MSMEEYFTSGASVIHADHEEKSPKYTYILISLDFVSALCSIYSNEVLTTGIKLRISWYHNDGKNVDGMAMKKAFPLPFHLCS